MFWKLFTQLSLKKFITLKFYSNRLFVYERTHLITETCVNHKMKSINKQ